LMQIMPATGKDIATERGLTDHTTEGLYDPAHNVDFGAWYLGQQLKAFGTSDPNETVEWAAAAYNGGPGRLQRFLADGGALSDQTMRYRRWVRGMWDERHRRQSATYATWYEAGGHRLVDLARAELVGKFTR
jgi:soluble lytic murein transglycosylase-like protein